MAMPSDWNCPICSDTRDGLAIAIPCQHQFCFGCLMRRTMKKQECPLCKELVESIKFSVWDENNYLTYCFMPPAEPSVADSSAEGAPGHLDADGLQGSLLPLQPAVFPAIQGAEGMDPNAHLGGIDNDVWAALFQAHQTILQPILPWMRQQLEGIYRSAWWKTIIVESLIVSILCLYGLDEQSLLSALQPTLQHYNTVFVRQLIDMILYTCSEEVQRLLGQDNSNAAMGLEENPMERPGAAGSPSGHQLSELPSTSNAILHGSPEGPLPVPVPAQQEKPCEELGQEAAAGCSGQGNSSSTSIPAWNQDRLRRRPCRAPARRARSSQQPPQPCKRPPQQGR